MMRSTLRRCSASALSTARGPARLPLTFSPNVLHNGFRFVKSHDFTELSIVAYEFVHEKTHCPYFHIDTADTNNAFCVGFCTPAVNSKGTTHVLEHTVLCGSAKYPVRDPFFAMLRRSLSTFMNAMTGADYTLYPFATVNEQDFSNLLDVYLDSVFQPLLRRDDFRQEGHRLEVAENETAGVDDAKKDESEKSGSGGSSSTTATEGSALKFNGVVFNEMRGVVSEPPTHFTHQLMRAMLPGTHYEHVSGGHPVDIVDLSYEELVEYHRNHYHPSNALVMTYGDLPPITHMKKVDDYLSRFERKTKISIPTLQENKIFTETKKFEFSGPLDAMGNPKKQKRTTVSIGVPKECDSLTDLVRFVVLDQLLTGGPSSPLYKALIQSQLGSRFAPMSGYAYYLTSPLVSYGVEGLDQDDAEAEKKVADAVLSTLSSVAEQGFDQRRVDSVVFQEELQQKHRSANYGIGLLTTACAMGLTRPHLHPLDFVNWVPHLSAIVKDQKNTVLPVLRKLLASPHRAQLTVSPSPTFLDALQAEINKKEAAASATFAPEDVAKLKSDQEKWLARVRQPQDFSILPTLRVSDIPRQGFVEPEPVRHGHGVYTIPYPTNGLVYVHGVIPFTTSVTDAFLQAKNMSFATANAREEQLMLPLLHSLLGKTGAGQLDEEELSIAIDLTCGGFGFSTCLEPRITTSTGFTAGTSWSFYTTREKLPRALDLLQVILAAPTCDSGNDKLRRCIQSRVKARCASRVQSLQRSGNAFAVSHAAARGTTLGFIKEHWSGVEQNNFCASVLQDLQGPECDAHAAKIADQYRSFTQQVAMQVPNSLVWATCQPDHTDDVSSQLSTFLLRFRALDWKPQQDAETKPQWHVEVPKGIRHATCGGDPVQVELPIDTAFVGSVVTNDLDRLSQEQQALRVTCSLVKNEYLHRKVREEGGAYGSSCSPYVQGAAEGVVMSSYRDPSPDKTVESFAGIPQWLRATTGPEAFTASMLDSAKLSLFSTIDAPYSADSFGIARLLNESTDELKQRSREMLLAVDAADVRRSAEYFDARQPSTTILKPAAAAPAS